jgi:hypothetical protein
MAAFQYTKASFPKRGKNQIPLAEALARKLLAKVELTLGADSLKAAEVLDVLVEALYRGGKSQTTGVARVCRTGD